MTFILIYCTGLPAIETSNQYCLVFKVGGPLGLHSQLELSKKTRTWEEERSFILAKRAYYLAVYDWEYLYPCLRMLYSFPDITIPTLALAFEQSQVNLLGFQPLNYSFHHLLHTLYIACSPPPNPAKTFQDLVLEPLLAQLELVQRAFYGMQELVLDLDMPYPTFVSVTCILTCFYKLKCP